jgi:hypothetical protein
MFVAFLSIGVFVLVFIKQAGATGMGALIYS